MKKLCVVGLLILLTGCATTDKSERGKEAAIGEMTKRLPPPPEPALPVPTIGTGERKEEITAPKTEAPAESLGKVVEAPAEKETPELLVKKDVPAEPGAKTPPDTTALDYSSWNGECIIYEAKWNFAPLGRALIACQEENTRYGQVYHMVAVTMPVGVMAKLGYGINRVDSYVNKETFEPYYFYSYTKTGKNERIIETEFDAAGKCFSWVLRKYERGAVYETRRGKVPYKDKIYDSLGVFYLIRGSNLDKEKSLQYPVGITKIWDLSVKVKGRRQEAVPPFPKQDLYLIEPIVKSDEGFFTEGKMSMWITANNQRLLISIFGKLALGTAKLTLLSSSRLKPGLALDQKNIAALLSSP